MMGWSGVKTLVCFLQIGFTLPNPSWATPHIHKQRVLDEEGNRRKKKNKKEEEEKEERKKY